MVEMMSDCLYKQFRRLTNAGVHDLSGLLPNCLRSMLRVMSSFIQVAVKLSAIFDSCGVRDIGRSWSIYGGWVLGMGTTVASFHWEGNSPCWIEDVTDGLTHLAGKFS